MNNPKNPVKFPVKDENTDASHIAVFIEKDKYSIHINGRGKLTGLWRGKSKFSEIDSKHDYDKKQAIHIIRIN